MICVMTRHGSSFDAPRIAGFTVPTLWRLVRWAVRGLIVLQAAVRALPAGRARAGLVRELGHGLGILETAVRCLLLMMRAPLCGGPARVMQNVPAEDPFPAAPLLRMPPETADLWAHVPRFSLRMKEIALPAGSAPPGAFISGVRPTRRIAPETRLARRLAALRHALLQPDAEAARMAAWMLARGYRRRAGHPLRPAAGFGPGRAWAALCARARPPRPSDTS